MTTGCMPEVQARHVSKKTEVLRAGGGGVGGGVGHRGGEQGMDPQARS